MAIYTNLKTRLYLTSFKATKSLNLTIHNTYIHALIIAPPGKIGAEADVCSALF